MTRKTLIGAVLAIVAAYLLAWPVSITPIAWEPLADAEAPPPRSFAGITRIADTGLAGPEYVEIGPDGSLYTGYLGGKIMRYDANGGAEQQVADTGGRPLGMRLVPSGDLIVADAVRGLLRIRMAAEPGRRVEVLVDSYDGAKLKIVDDVIVTRDERFAYFTDASSKFTLDAHLDDIIEHGGHGRLLRYDFTSGDVREMLSGLQFANGLAFGPDETFLVVAESGSYQLRRYWLSGPRAGTAQIFATGLPGFPDNVTFNGRDRFWVALANPRNPTLDDAAPYPVLRKVTLRLPQFLRPQPEKVALAVALDLEGNVVDYLADKGGSGHAVYAPITTVQERDGALIIGSLSEQGIGRFPL